MAIPLLIFFGLVHQSIIHNNNQSIYKPIYRSIVRSKLIIYMDSSIPYNYRSINWNEAGIDLISIYDLIYIFCLVYPILIYIYTKVYLYLLTSPAFDYLSLVNFSFSRCYTLVFCDSRFSQHPPYSLLSSPLFTPRHSLPQSLANRKHVSLSVIYALVL